jgi:pyridoxamine 5'-phosphate oxidase
MAKDLRSLRKDYQFAGLDHKSLPPSPFVLLAQWLDEALQCAEPEATAMVLSTVSGSQPSSRVVLLKELSETGLVFFSNYESRKGQELELNPFASCLFFWPGLERQLRAEGRVTTLDAAESRLYFDSRPRESRISAIISPQSREIDLERAELENAYAIADAAHAMMEPPMPQHWGGYTLIPNRIEFWQGRPNRLHDRLLYKNIDGAWEIFRLAP